MMRARVTAMDGATHYVEFTETSPTPTLEHGMNEWRDKGWKMAVGGYAITWQAVANVAPDGNNRDMALTFDYNRFNHLMGTPYNKLDQ